MEPVRFERKGGAKPPKGCIVYLVMIPALTLFLWIVAVALLIPVFNLFQAPEPVRNGINVYFFFMILITVIKGSLADFRRRGAAVTVWPDRIQIEGRRDLGPSPSRRSAPSGWRRTSRIPQWFCTSSRGGPAGCPRRWRPSARSARPSRRP